MEDFVKLRTDICKKCPICDLDRWICNSKLYLNPITNDVSTVSKKDYIKGCGCALSMKIPNKNKRCPAKKW